MTRRARPAPPAPGVSDYREGERVFGPPSGSFDADWVAVAAGELVPDADPAALRALARQAWERLRAGPLGPADLGRALGGTPAAQAVARAAVDFCAAYDVRP